MFLKKVLILISFIIFLAGCDLADNIKKKENPTNPELSSLTINGNNIVLESGVFNYRYLLIASDGATSDIVIDADTKDGSTTITGIGRKSVKNPEVIQDPYNSDKDQASTDTDFKIEIVDSNGNVKSSYIITISSAPYWLESTLVVSGDGKDLEGKGVWFSIWNPELCKRLYNYVELKPVKTQEVAVPLPIGYEHFIWSQITYNVNFDVDPDSRYGGYRGELENLDIKVTKNKIYKSPTVYLNRIKKLEIVNFPSELEINSSIYDATIFYRKIDTGEYIYIADFVLDDDKYIFTDHILGTFEVLIVGPNSMFMSLGIYTFTETTNIVLDAAGHSIKEYSELGPQVLGVTNNNLNSSEIIFSQTMDTSSVEDALKIYNAEKFYAGESDAEVDITQYVWSNDNKTLTVNHLLNSDTLYLYKVLNKAVNLTGEKIYFEFNTTMKY